MKFFNLFIFFILTFNNLLHAETYKVKIEKKHTYGYIQEGTFNNSGNESNEDFSSSPSYPSEPTQGVKGEATTLSHNLSKDPSILFDGLTTESISFGRSAYIDFSLSERSQVSVHISGKSSQISYSMLALQAQQDVYDSLGNLIMKTSEYYTFTNDGWNTIPFNLDVGNYKLFYRTTNYGISVTEINIEAPSLRYLPSDQNLITYTNDELSKVGILNDQLTTHSVDFGRNSFLDFSISERSKISVHISGKSSQISHSMLSLQALQDVYDALGNLIMKSGEYYTFTNNGWNLIPFNLDAGNYKLFYRTTNYGISVTEIKAEKTEDRVIPENGNSILFVNDNLSNVGVLNDQLTTNSVHFGNGTFLDFSISERSKISVHISGKSSRISHSMLSLQALQDVYDTLGNLIMKSGEFYSFTNNGWNTVPFNLDVGDYKLFYRASNYGISVTEIKAEKSNNRTTPNNQNPVLFVNDNLSNVGVLNDQLNTHSVSFSNGGFLNFSLSEKSRFSIYISGKSNQISYSMLSIQAKQNVYDNLGNLVLSSGDFYNFTNNGWNIVPFDLTVGDYKLFYRAGSYAISVAEIKADKIN